MAEVLLRLPDEMLKALDEARRHGEPRLVLIREAITEKIRVRNRVTINPVRVSTADGGSRFVPGSLAADPLATAVDHPPRDTPRGRHVRPPVP